MGREKPEREEKEEEECSGKKVGPGLNAGSSAPRSMAPVTLALSPLAGHETWPGARCQSMNGAELRIHFMNSFR